MRAYLAFIFCLLFSVTANADDYQKLAKAAAAQVWEWKIPAFENRTIPSEYDGASSVILAWHKNITATGSSKLRFDPMLLVANKSVLSYIYTDRLLVKINDEAALNEYSEISFQQYQKSKGFTTSAVYQTFVGARIFKADGTMKEIEIADAVMTKDEKQDKQRKLAIPGLQVGDIIDYFIMSEMQMDNMNIPPMTFLFGGQSPILSYAIHCEFGNQLTVEYRSLNGAPEFTLSTSTEGNRVLDAEMKNIPEVVGSIWTSPVFQYPYIRLAVSFNSINIPRSPGARKAGVYPNPPYADILEDAKWEVGKEGAMIPKNGFYFDEIKAVVDRYEQKHPGTEVDSLAAIAYYALRHYLFNSPSEFINVDNERNFNGLRNNRSVIISLERTLQKLGLGYNLGFCSPLFGEKALMANDMELILTSSSEHPECLSSPTIFRHANYIPEEYEENEVATISVQKYKPNGNIVGQTGQVVLPRLDAKNNKITNAMVVSFDKKSLNLILDRTVSMSGHLRESFQQLLLLFEQYEAEERQVLGIEQSFFDELKEKKKTAALVPEYESAFAAARKKQKDYFKSEAQYYHEKEVEELIDYEIINTGITHWSPEFRYRIKYLIGSYVKQVGNDYIVDIGKLIGVPLMLPEKERDRTLDIFMPFARAYETTVALQIPDGYSVEGVNALNRSISNSCGTFTVSSEIKDKQLIVKIDRAYQHHFEPAAKWLELLKIIDAALDFYGQTVLLRQTT